MLFFTILGIAFFFSCFFPFLVYLPLAFLFKLFRCYKISHILFSMCFPSSFLLIDTCPYSSRKECKSWSCPAYCKKYCQYCKCFSDH